MRSISQPPSSETSQDHKGRTKASHAAAHQGCRRLDRPGWLYRFDKTNLIYFHQFVKFLSIKLCLQSLSVSNFFFVHKLTTNANSLSINYHPITRNFHSNSQVFIAPINCHLIYCVFVHLQIVCSFLFVHSLILQDLTRGRPTSRPSLSTCQLFVHSHLFTHSFSRT